MFFSSEKLAEKTEATNAADAAAYSSGAWASKQLNYIAYTNRAMVANHVAVGHAVAYVSWIRYVEQLSQGLATVTSAIPYVNVVTNTINRLSTGFKQLAEVETKLFVPMAESVNKIYALSQYLAISELRKTTDIMKDVAKTYDKDFVINDPSQLPNSSSDNLKSILSGVLLAQKASLFSLAEIVSSSDTQDFGQMKKLAGKSFAGSHRWLTDRRWKRRFLFFYRFHKNASHNHELASGTVRSMGDKEKGSKWEFGDDMEFGVRKWRCRFGRRCGWRWYDVTIARGEAKVDEFSSLTTYKGVTSYGKLRSDDQDFSFNLYSLVTKKVGNGQRIMIMKNKSSVVSALSAVTVYYDKPMNLFGGKRHYANLFNPFWRVKLVNVENALKDDVQNFSSIFD